MMSTRLTASFNTDSSMHLSTDHYTTLERGWDAGQHMYFVNVLKVIGEHRDIADTDVYT